MRERYVRSRARSSSEPLTINAPSCEPAVRLASCRSLRLHDEDRLVLEEHLSQESGDSEQRKGSIPVTQDSDDFPEFMHLSTTPTSYRDGNQRRDRRERKSKEDRIGLSQKECADHLRDETDQQQRREQAYFAEARKRGLAQAIEILHAPDDDQKEGSGSEETDFGKHLNVGIVGATAIVATAGLPDGCSQSLRENFQPRRRSGGAAQRS